MVISMAIQLTDEQQQVVNHNHGPALVFAVAGAGKTTAMVHRIARLSRERIFAPQRILATSFSRAAVQDIHKALRD
jgi:DNA helicase-2/ATP-dependent DNA helicase PcrA